MTGGSPAKACLCGLGIRSSNHPCNIRRNKAFEGGIRRIFMVAVQIEISVEESRDITALRWTSHHWPASHYSCRSHPCRCEPPIDKDTDNPAENVCLGEIIDENTNESATYNSDPADTTTHPKFSSA